MRRAWSSVVFVLLAAATCARAELVADVRKALASPAIAKAEVGVQVIALGATRAEDRVVVDVAADVPRIPASNQKIITTALALETLGPDFRFRTRAAIDDADNVALIGDGDPTLGDREYLEKSGWTTTTVFENWATALRQNGVTRVNDVVVDDSIFEPLMAHPNWPREQAHRAYVPQVAGVNLNANCLDVYVAASGGRASYRTDPATRYASVDNRMTVGAPLSLHLSRELGSNRVILKGTAAGSGQTPFRVTIDDPPLFAATVLAETLARQGIVVSGKVRRDRTVRATIEARPEAWHVFAVHETPLSLVLARTNKDSVNLYADALGKRAVADQTKSPGSWASLAESQAAFVRTAGVPAGAQAFDDGCGLSKENRVAPAAFGATLAFMYHGARREAYVSSMSVGGVDGTLDNRFKSNGLAGRVFAKSGSVNGVSTLSGYLRTTAGDWYAFSILMNRIAGLRGAQQAQDAIVKAIDDNAAS